MKKVVIYGCGNNFLNSFKFLNSEYEIVALIDGSPEKRGMQIGGYIIQGIDAIKALVYDKIIVTPNVYLEITEVLLNNGICENNIWYLHELKPVNITGNVLNVCFFVMGEIEDKIINLNYIYHFYTRYQNANMKIDLMCDHDTELIKAFVDANSIFKSICTYKEEALNKQYDLFIKILRYVYRIRLRGWDTIFIRT